ncbi:MAG TPA: DeoR family transcriptional regulator [Candidatus Omnitrophica bacterium]|nr:DeoR family transcriptional regulator [Candidatus Omnitrophota bacterium]
MRLPELSIRRPVTVIMFYLGIIILGIISWSRLPQELFPSISYPQITIVTTYENASPQEIETLITKIIEEAVGTVNGLKKISSISKEGLSLIILDFDWGTNMDFASLSVREKIDLIKERLPLGAEDPIVMKYNPFEIPILILSVRGEMSSRELRELCRKEIKDELEKIEGVASANIVGGREREILVELDQGKLFANKIPILKVAEAIKQTNFTFPAGTIKERFYEYLIRTIGEFQAVKEVEKVVVDVQEVNPPQTQYEAYLRQLKGKTSDKRVIHVVDVGRVLDTLKDLTNISRYNGHENISIRIQRQAGANIIKVTRLVKKQLKEIQQRLKDRKVDIQIIYDQSQFIRDSIKGVKDAAVQGGVLAFFVLLFFLMNIWSSLIVTLSIPISIMLTFSLMYFRHLSVNIMSLGGLALGVGMLVDNAIVVMENIFRHRQLGKPSLQSASKGASEVAAAIVASTLTTIAVFLPLIFVKGVAGQLFKELAFTVTFSLLASLIVALSLIPRLAARIKTKNVETKERFWLRILRTLYLNSLTVFLKFKYIFLAGIILITAVCFVMLKGVDKELMPKVDQREFMIKVDMPTGTKIEVTDRVVKRIENILLTYPDIKGVSVIIGSSKEKEYGGTVQTLGPHQAQIVVNLKKMSKRDPRYRKSQDVIHQLQRDLVKVDLEGARLEYVLQETIFKAALQGGKPVNIEVKGRDMEVLRSISEKLMQEMKKVSGLYDISSDLMPAQPEVKINIMKDKAALYNLSVNSISLSAQAAIKGYVASKYKEEGREYDIRVRLREEDRNDLVKIRNILIHSPLGIEVPLADVAYLSRGLGPSEIHRLDQERTVIVSANIYKRGFSEVVVDIDRIIAGMEIPKGYVVRMSGERKEMEESFKSLIFALILAVVLVYMIMASQFESLWQPFIIMFTLPLSIIGVTVALLLTHTTLNVVVFLGMIVLGGIVVNNGIVLIDRVNGLRREGFSPYDAVVEAGQNRLRPILMTAMTTTLGLIPLALGLGEGAELRAPMAITVIGGLTSSTFLTLFVIPALYLIAVNIMERRPKMEEKKEKREELKPEKVIVIVSPEEKEKREEITEEYEFPEEEIEDLNPRQKKALQYIKKQGKITRKEYIQLFNVSVATAARDIKELQKKGIIIPRGPNGPGRWYEINKKNFSK